MNFDKNLHYTSIVRIAYMKSHVEGKELVLHKSNKIKMKNNKKVRNLHRVVFRKSLNRYNVIESNRIMLKNYH